MQLSTHLSFDGRCEEALRHYEKCLGGGVVVMLRYGETPVAEQFPADWRDKIMHATLSCGDCRLTGCDPPPDQYEKPRGVGLLLSLSDIAKAERIFNALSPGAEVQMPLQETFWAVRFGMLTDRYGIPWLINCGKAE